MQLPTRTASPKVRAVFSDYVSARMVRAGLDGVAAALDAATVGLVEAARKLDGLQRRERRAIANRDHAGDGLREAVHRLRLGLASRSTGAVREAPYVQLFPKGAEHYTACRLRDRAARVLDLIGRVEAYLDEGDPLRIEVLPALRAGLDAWRAETSRVMGARSATALARIERDEAVRAWRRAVEAAYGELMIRFGKAAAERFFPRPRREPALPEAPAQGSLPDAPQRPHPDAASQAAPLPDAAPQAVPSPEPSSGAPVATASPGETPLAEEAGTGSAPEVALIGAWVWRVRIDPRDPAQVAESRAPRGSRSD